MSLSKLTFYPSISCFNFGNHANVEEAPCPSRSLFGGSIYSASFAIREYDLADCVDDSERRGISAWDVHGARARQCDGDSKQDSEAQARRHWDEMKNVPNHFLEG